MMRSGWGWFLANTLLICPLVAQNDKTEERQVSLNVKKFASNFFSDQKMIWTFPAKLATGTGLIPAFAIAGTTASLVPLDPPTARFVRRNSKSFDRFNRVFSENHTTYATLLTPAAFYAAGLITRDSYLKRTGLLAAEAWVDADLTNIAFRSATRRLRPLDVPPGGDLRDTWFKTSGNPLKSAGSFPSGHTAWFFAVATVVARRHSSRRWVPFVAYGVATVASFSRITSSNHFVSDNVFGAALGYSIGRFVVLRE
jgi:membrane-associated phospholipid phosphatase